MLRAHHPTPPPISLPGQGGVCGPHQAAGGAAGGSLCCSRLLLPACKPAACLACLLPSAGMPSFLTTHFCAHWRRPPTALLPPKGGRLPRVHGHEQGRLLRAHGWVIEWVHEGACRHCAAGSCSWPGRPVLTPASRRRPSPNRRQRQGRCAQGAVAGRPQASLLLHPADLLERRAAR